MRKGWILAVGVGACAMGIVGCGASSVAAPPEPDGGQPPLVQITAPAIASFTAAPSAIARGEKATLTWQQTGATALAIAPGVGAVPTASASLDVSPLETTTYTLTATNEGGTTTSQPVTVAVGPPHPTKIGAWTYYDTGQGLSQDIHDVSADEGGNVYVAGGDALYVKTRADEQFRRFDARNGGLTENCFDDQYSQCDTAGFPPCSAATPPPSYRLCRVLSVAGASAGKAVVGYDGYGDEVQSYTDWAARSGGADVVAFDPDKEALSRTRHVWIMSPPHTVCTAPGASEERAPPGYDCPKQDGWWTSGRPLVRRILRVAVNHDPNSAKYGDVWFCGEHGTFSALMNNATARGMYDRTAAFPRYAEAKDVWEHLHPSLHDASNPFINDRCYGLSLDPRSGTPWASNQYRTAYVPYPDNLADDNFGMLPYVTPTCPTGATWCAPAYAGYDLWPDPYDAAKSSGAYYWPNWNFDGVVALSHCPDGTLWVGSSVHGLARIDAGGTPLNTFGNYGPALTNPIQSLACDPLDSSVWIGFQNGQLGRLRMDGKFAFIDASGAPDFAKHVVQSIQVDRWAGSGKRILYFAFSPSVDQSGAITSGGGVASYSGD